MSRTIRRSLIVLLGLILVMSVFCLGRADAATKGIKAAVNADSGIRITWTKESGQDGYHIYRQIPGHNSWKLIKTINNPSTVKWIDKKTYNAHSYIYKVFSFKGDKEKKNSLTVKAYRVYTPRITKLYNIGNRSFQIRTNKNSKATGFQVRYSLSSKFKSSTSFYKETKQLNIKVKKLKPGKKYYVKVRAYKIIGGKKRYSAWSKVRTVKVTSSYTAYTTNIWTYMYPKMKADEKTAVKVWYHTPLKILEDSAVYATGKWTKVKYKGKTYYMWTDKGDSKVTKSAPLTSYTGFSKNDFQKNILEKAFFIMKNWDTKYDYTHRTEDGVAESDGKYAFDCSGFCSYVVNTVMQETCPAFELSPATTKRADAIGMYEQDVIVNEGLKGEVRIETLYDIGEKVRVSKLQVGDLLFFDDSDDVKGDIDHVGMYIGNGEFIQSTKAYMKDPNDLIDGEPEGGVCIAPLAGDYMEDILAVRRITPQKVESAEVKMVTTKGVTIYGDSKCKVGQSKELARLAPGTPVTLMFTMKKGSHLNAYVSYEGGEGFVFEYQDRLSEE